MPVHPFDYTINPHVYSTPEYEAIFDEEATYQRWLDFESSLARAQAKLGIIPADSAEEISARANLASIDLEAVKAGYRKSRNSVVPLLAGLRRSCTGNHGEYVHYGATTQDVLDSGEIIALRKTLSLLYRDLRGVEKVCLELAARHKATPMAARSHGQQALPTTFGLKAAIWASEIRRSIGRITRLHSTVNCGQLSGAVGTYAALGPSGLQVAKETMAGLGLDFSPLSWHTSRDHIAELACNFSIIGMTCAKIANEIFQLQKTEIGELLEPSISGALASSTMPHKQNPVICQRVVALSKHIKGLATIVVESSAHEHERDPRSLWSEWLAIPQLCIYTGNVVSSILSVLSGLNVRPERMLENLHRQKQFICTEWLLFQLSGIMPKSEALAKLHKITEAAGNGNDLKDAILSDPVISSHFSEKDLAPLDNPEHYTGQAEKLVELTLTEMNSLRRSDPETL